MNLLLVKPYVKSHLVSPPIGLGYLATAVRDNHDVAILDCVKERMNERLFADYLNKHKFDVIGFQTYSYDLLEVRKSLRIVKEINPDTITIIGGPHPTCLPDQAMTYLEAADYGFTGEAEIGLPLLLNNISAKSKKSFSSIPGLIRRKNSKIMINKPIRLKNLDSLGHPAWDLIQPQEYPHEGAAGGFVRNFPVAPIMTTRGCPCLCTFCAGPVIFGHKIRFHSLKNILSQIDILYHKFGIREIQIVDDNFTFNINFAKNFCSQVIKKDYNLSFYIPSGIRIDRIDEELAVLMRKAGFYDIAVGIESGSDRILQSIKKNTSVSQICEKIKLIRKAGLEVNGFFVIGFPDETPGDIIKTINLACKLDLKRASFSCCQPLPGTEIYYNLKKNGKLKAINWEKTHFSKISFIPDKLTYFRLVNLHRYAFLRILLKPKILMNLIKEITSFNHVKFLLKRFRDYIIKK